MDIKSHSLDRLRKVFSGGIDVIETVGLLIIVIATSVAMVQETRVMIDAQRVHLADLLLMFLFLEVLAMIGQYFKLGQLPVRFPLYIAMVALARYMILDLKEMTEWRMLAVAAAILLLTVAVLIIRYGHIRLPYREDPCEPPRKGFIRE